LITATNRDLRAQIAAGTFREDLYYRLNVIQIAIPPLRQRGDDVLLLLDHYLQHFASTHRLPTPVLHGDAQQTLLAYPWPGNVRELRNIAERLVLQDRQRELTPWDLPEEVRDQPAATGRPFAPVTIASIARRPAPPATTGVAMTLTDKAAQLWDRMQAGEDFWSVVHRAFKARELTRTELAALVDRGLSETRGSYRALLKVFNLPATDYKRLHAFLYQQQCNLPVGPYRQLRPGRDLSAPFHIAS